MPHIITKPASFPTEEQELLLKAALLMGDSCKEAWNAWKARIDIEKLDPGSSRLLPLAYHNLFQNDIQDPLMVRLKSVYRHTLTKNHLMFHNVAPFLRALQEKGIQTMLLKGAALNVMNYKNYGLRPQRDIDVLVPNKYAEQAFLTLLKSGLNPGFSFPIEKVLRFRHSCGFDGGVHECLDLHWNILEECRSATADNIFWQRSVPVQLNDITTCVLAPADQLLHVCAHGIKWNTDSPIRWVADAMTILLTPEQPLNWEDLVVQARERQLTLSVRAAMHYLKETFDAPVPDSVLAAMDALPVSKYEQREFQIRTRKKNRVFGNFFKFTCGYRRLPRPKNFLSHLVMYPQFLQMQWKAENIFLMPFQLVAESIRSNVRRKTIKTQGGHS